MRRRESEKVGQLALGSIVPISASGKLESGLERVKFESEQQRLVLRAKCC